LEKETEQPNATEPSPQETEQPRSIDLEKETEQPNGTEPSPQETE
jgi:hypothetical protein